jgi:hypothetical protein
VANVGAVEGTATVTVEIPAPGEMIRWASSTNGDWSDTEKWNLGRLPGANDTVVIDLPGVYRVTVDTPTEFTLLLLGNPARDGVQSIDILERVTVRDSLHANRVTWLYLGGPNAVLDGEGSVTCEGGLGFYAGRMAIDVTVGLDGGTLTFAGAGDKVISDGAVLTYIQVAHFYDSSTVTLQDGGTIQWKYSPSTYYDWLTGAFEVVGQMVLQGSGRLDLRDARIGFLATYSDATTGSLLGRIDAQQSILIDLSNADFMTRVPGSEPAGTVTDLILLSDQSTLTGPVVDVSAEYDPVVNPVGGIGLRAVKQ